MAVDVVSVEVRDNARGCRFGEVTYAVVGHRNGRGIVGVGCRDELPGVVVGVVGGDAACPSATSKFAVGGVVVRRALAVGVHLVRHAARRFVVEPAGGVSTKGKITVRRHGYFGADLVHLFSLC